MDENEEVKERVKPEYFEGKAPGGVIPEPKAKTAPTDEPVAESLKE
jgi:hypothetical protein